MKIVADFHIHSKYSRATSKEMNIDNLAVWAGIKGINVLGTGDFTHPKWIKELKERLEPAEPGLYKPRKDSGKMRFVLTAEVSCIYFKEGRTRKIHIIIIAPSFKAVEKINRALGKTENLETNGRPVLGIDAEDLLKIALEASEDCLIVPAHAWTPWFSVFGSKSGFDSLKECFGDNSKHIYAIETGLSSDPEMNWRLSSLDSVALISNSDSHSPGKIGREANVFNTDLDYFSIIKAIKRKDPEEFLHTIEFFPEEGKYFYDGHRFCDVRLSPVETGKRGGTCPVCGKKTTIGVLNRVEKLADRPENFEPPNAIPFKSIVPLKEIIADAMGVGVSSKKVSKEYDNLINKLGGELNILTDTEESEIRKIAIPAVFRGIVRVRCGEVCKHPGYDGVYGKIDIFGKEEKRSFSAQRILPFV